MKNMILRWRLKWNNYRYNRRKRKLMRAIKAFNANPPQFWNRIFSPITKLIITPTHPSSANTSSTIVFLRPSKPSWAWKLGSFVFSSYRWVWGCRSGAVGGSILYIVLRAIKLGTATRSRWFWSFFFYTPRVSGELFIPCTYSTINTK